MMASLDGGPAARLVESMSKAEYSAGHLLYLNGTTLTAQPFDPDQLHLTSPAIALVTMYSAAREAAVRHSPSRRLAC